MWVNTRSGAEVRKRMWGSLLAAAHWPHSSEVRTGSRRVHQVRATPEPRTGLWVRFSPSAESWTGPGSGSLKVQVRTKVRNRTVASLVEREDKNEFRTCATAESCQSNGLQEISNHRNPLSSLAISSCPKSVMATAKLKKSTHAAWNGMNVSV